MDVFLCGCVFENWRKYDCGGVLLIKRLTQLPTETTGEGFGWARLWLRGGGQIIFTFYGKAIFLFNFNSIKSAVRVIKKLWLSSF